MRRLLTLLTICAMTVVLATAERVLAVEMCVATESGSGIQQQTLYAGQTINAGTVSVEVEGDVANVTFNTIDGWQLVEAHLWVGADMADMPQTRKGNPKIGNFPYNSGTMTGAVTSYTFSVPLDTIGAMQFCETSKDTTHYYVAAHAALQKVDGNGNVIQTETGWADGDTFVSKGSWATYFTFTIDCHCNKTPPEPLCETAFSFGGEGTANDFLLIDENADGKGDFNRWGWSNGPLGPGTYSFDIYAGAGQSDITKGTLVGTLTVVYNNEGVATVTYNMNGDFKMDETHLYVGNDMLPTNGNGDYTVAPGQYPYIHDDDNYNEMSTDSYTVTGLLGDIYVVSHAVVCGAFD